MSSQYLLALGSQKSHEEYEGGKRKKANKKNFPILDGLSVYQIELEPGGFREPHWHPNAHELCYCLEGRAAIAIFGPGAAHDSFQLTSGDIAFIPKGYLHHIENIAETKTSLAVGFNHESPQEFELSQVFFAAGPSVMAATFDQDPSFFSNFKDPKEARVITKKSSQKPQEGYWKANRHKFQLQAIAPQIDVAGGTIALSYKENFNIVKGLTLYDLRLNVGGVREPHWHPNAAELDYCVSGTARMLIMDPHGTKEVFEVHPGDVVYIPSAYYHYIENIGKEELHFAIYFNHESPEDIGISGCLGAYHPEVLSAALGTTPSLIKPLQGYREDVFIGPRLLTGY